MGLPISVGGYKVNLCYCDESGTGDEPIATMVGIVVDAQRMHLTKAHWVELLDELSDIAGTQHQIAELHTRNFYAGREIWQEIDGKERAEIFSSIFAWIGIRKHRVVYSSVLKESYFRAWNEGHIPDELNTIWRFLGFHLILAMQKFCQREPRNKGHTIFVFDNEERERMRFTDIITRPPAWSDFYYATGAQRERLDQIVDVPYFGDSKDVTLIQVADVAAFFLRRYAEIKEGLVQSKYADEEQRVTGWIMELMKRSIGSSYLYPKRRVEAEDIFYRHTPKSIRDL